MALDTEEVPEGGDKRVLVVGGGLFQLDIIRAARALGVETAVVDRNPDAPGFEHADHPLIIDTSDVDDVVAAAKRLKVHGVVTAASDVAVAAVAGTVEALGLTGVSRQVAHRGQDKLATFKCLRAAGLGTPTTVVIHDEAGAESRIDEVGGYPVVIKPPSSAGGRGVTVVERPGDLTGAVQRAMGHAGPGRPVLLQRFARGRSVGVEAFFWRSELVSAFILGDQYREGFVSPVGHCLPAPLDAKDSALVKHAVSDYRKAFGFEDGPVNFDLRLDDDGVNLIEVNIRLGGNSITDLVREAHGVNLSEATVLTALGQDPTGCLSTRSNHAIAARLLLGRGHGTVHFRGDPMAALQRPEVLALDLSVEAGKAPAMRVDDWSLLGRVLTRADSAEAATEMARGVAGEVETAIVLGSDA